MNKKTILIIAFVLACMLPNAFAALNLSRIYSQNFTNLADWSGGSYDTGLKCYKAATDYQTWTSPNLNLDNYSYFEFRFAGYSTANHTNLKYRLWESNVSADNPHVMADFASGLRFRPEPGYSPDYTHAYSDWENYQIHANKTEGNYSFYHAGTFRWTKADTFNTTATRNYLRIETGDIAATSYYCMDNVSVWVLANEAPEPVEPPAATPYVTITKTAPAGSPTVDQNDTFTVTVNVTCHNATCGDVSVYLDPINPALDLNAECANGAGLTCQEIIDDWDDASWDDLVDENLGTSNLAAVKWYTHEASYTLKTDAEFPTLDAATHHFGGVTDEFSNVMISQAMGTNQTRYEKLHNFAMILRHPSANNLQCWKYYVDGTGTYNSYDDVCVASDSASDASLNILGAMGIACSKQRNGTWTNVSVDYCEDYVAQGDAIFGHETVSHGEIKRLSNGKYFLANGYNNQVSSPTNTDAFRPDYYRLHFIYEFGIYTNNATRRQAAIDMLNSYVGAMGAGYMTQGKTGHFSSDGYTGYTCDQNCASLYVDNTDTWRGVLFVGGFYSLYSANLSSFATVFDYWDTEYLQPYAYNAAKPFEIYSDGTVKSTDSGYKTMAMWIPSAAGFNPTYTANAVDHLRDSLYSSGDRQFSGATYFGGYYSQYAIHAVGFATGAISAEYYAASSFNGSTGKGGLVSTVSGATPFWTSSANPQTCDLSVNESCIVSWTVNATGNAGTYTFFAFVNGTNVTQEQTATWTVTIDVPLPPNATDLSLSFSPSLSIAYGTSATVTGLDCPSGVACYLYRSGTLVSNPYTATLGAGNYTFLFNTSGNANWTADAAFATLTVSKVSPSLALSFSPDNEVANGTQTNVTGTNCPAQLTCTLYRNGVAVSNPDSQTLGVANYTYVFNTTGNANYTTATTSSVLEVSLVITPPTTDCENNCTWQENVEIIRETLQDFVLFFIGLLLLAVGYYVRNYILILFGGVWFLGVSVVFGFQGIFTAVFYFLLALATIMHGIFLFFNRPDETT